MLRKFLHFDNANRIIQDYYQFSECNISDTANKMIFNVKTSISFLIDHFYYDYVSHKLRINMNKFIPIGSNLC